MNNKKAEKLLTKAITHKNESERLVCEAIREIAKKKGFSEETLPLFDACFASGVETVITFNGEGEMLDCSLELFDEMTKEEFIHEWLYRKDELSVNTIKILESEL